MSAIGPGEGTLRVVPMLKLATTYLILRPFFKPRTPSSGLDDWVVDLESAAFPGSQIGKTQELREATHPHLQLSRTTVSVPRVEPGDQVYCELVPVRSGSRLIVALQGTAISYMRWKTRTVEKKIPRFYTSRLFR
jgi:hypothetical protein